jgi:Adenylate and Guanylate cyclase catalytic domain
MVSALLDSGLPAETIERAAAEGLLAFQRTDEYLPYRPGPRSERTYADFQADAGPGAELLPGGYEVLGLAIHTDEEGMFERFLEVWAATPDQDSLIRAARLMAQGTRAVMLGWTDLMDEQLAEPARQRLLRGELERFPDEVPLWLHAGINAGPVIKRDLDVFGQTVNVASRIADVAGPGEVLASEAVVEAAADDRFGFEPTEDARLEGLQSPVALYRVSRSARPLRHDEHSPE